MSNSLALDKILLIIPFVPKDIILYLLFKILYFQHYLIPQIAYFETIYCQAVNYIINFFKQKFNFHFLIYPYYPSIRYSINTFFFQIYCLKWCFSDMANIFIPLYDQFHLTRHCDWKVSQNSLRTENKINEIEKQIKSWLHIFTNDIMKKHPKWKE